MDWLLELLLPSTDALVALEVVVVLAVGTGLVMANRRDPDRRLFWLGATIFSLSLMGLRAIH